MVEADADELDGRVRRVEEEDSEGEEEKSGGTIKATDEEAAAAAGAAGVGDEDDDILGREGLVGDRGERGIASGWHVWPAGDSDRRLPLLESFYLDATSDGSALILRIGKHKFWPQKTISSFRFLRKQVYRVPGSQFLPISK